MHLIVLLAALASLTNALYTPKGSSCTIECGTKAQNFTGTGDLVCLDTAYSDSSEGVLFKQCLSCLSTSTYINDAASYNGNSDQYWYLWHLKYVQQYCLVDTPQTAAAKNCAAQCNPLKTPLDVSWIYNKNGVQSQYEFCSWNSSQYMTYADSCASCLHGQEGGVVIGNMADTTYNACQSQPMIVNGGMVVTPSNLFDTDSSSAATSSTSDSSTATASQSTESTNTSNSKESTSATVSSGSASATNEHTSSAASTKSSKSTISGTFTATSGSSSQPTASTASSEGNTNTSSSTGLPTAAAVGIGIGATIAVIALAAGIFLLLRRRKKADPTTQRLTTPPTYSHELGNDSQLNEIGEGEKNPYGHKVSVYENKYQYPQELDASSRH